MLPSLSENYLTRGFWGDEAWTSLISQLPYAQMLETTAADFHPPAYYTIVAGFYQIFPPTEVVTRLVSVVFYLLTVLFVFKSAKLIKNKQFAILAAILVLASPVFFTYAFEARNYTMFAFAGTGSFYFLLKLLEKFTFKNAFFFFVFSTLGIYTHYYMFFAIAAQSLYLLFFERNLLTKIVYLYITIAVAYLPWVPFLYSQLTSVKSGYWISSINAKTHVEAIFRIISGEHQNFLQQPLFFLITSLLLFGIVRFLAKNLAQKKDTLEKRAYGLLWFWVVFSFLLASLPGLSVAGFHLPFRPIFFWRYLIPTAIPLSLLVVVSASYLPKKGAYLVLGFIIFISIFIDYATFKKYPLTFKQVYQTIIVPQIGMDDKIVTVLPSFAEVLYYRNQNNLTNEIIVLPEGLVQYSGKSLLDTYVKNGMVHVDKPPSGRYFELMPGPSVKIVENLGN